MSKFRTKARIVGLMLSATLVASLAVAAQPTPQIAEAAISNTVCSAQYNATSWASSWGNIKPMAPISSSGSTDCRLFNRNPMIVNNAVTALQNALAFSDYNLRAKPTAKWQYAGILVGGGKLADNNWGIDGKFGVKTYNAVKAFQKNHGLGQDGIFGNETRQDGYLLFGENSIRSNGYKYQAVGVFKSGSTWYNYGTTRTYAYN